MSFGLRINRCFLVDARAAMDHMMPSDGGADNRGGQELPPVAPKLMQSLRAFGYSLPAALADLCDNSLTANATRIEIRSLPRLDPCIAILDDGSGMDEKDLVSAMRFGSADPRDDRAAGDLGRFGLGLKTASLSQCRRLTVASKRDGKIAVARWDLDICDRRQTWWLERPSASDLPSLVLDWLENYPAGTAVVWQELDRIIAPGDDHRSLDDQMSHAIDHLALVFHRFISGDVGRKVTFTVNGRELPRLDPFLDGHVRGQTIHPESFTVDGREVTVAPFVLPYPQQLKQAEIAKAGGRESLKTGHGFYIYRGGRLVVPGGWHRIVPSDDTARLARVRVDVPVELDHIWKVDVRKASAEPPPRLRPHLRRLVETAINRSRNVITHKVKPPKADHVSIWSRIDGRDGAARWIVNREHPLLAALASGLTEQQKEALFRTVEDAMPIDAIRIHLVNHLAVEPPPDPTGDFEAKARAILTAMGDDPAAAQRLLDHLHLIEPFDRNPDEAHRLARQLRKELSAE